MTQNVEHVPVLIAGGGYAGLAASLFLAEHGVTSLLVDRREGASLQGRARGINQRSMELYRPLGLDGALRRAREPFDGDAGVARCATLTGEWEWLFEPDPDPGLATLSPSAFCMADQSSVEPILRDAALARGANQRPHTELVTATPDADGVTAMLRDLATGTSHQVRADYLLAADGHRSPIRDQVGIPRTGPGVTQHWASIVIAADLDDVITQRALFWIVLNDRLGFASFVTTADRGRWAVSVTYDPATTAPSEFTPARCIDIAHAAIGRDDLAIDVLDVGFWEQAVAVADTYRAGRVFLVGDSAHVWPPAGAMGANSAVQDAHNLAWKLAAVLNGAASDRLLDTYEAERRPVATALADLTVRRQAARFGGGLDDDIDDIVCTLGQRYQSGAIFGPTTSAPFGAPVATTPEPGARLPHVWLDRLGQRISSLDLAHDGFVLLTDQDGAGWLTAAQTVAGASRVPVATQVISTDGELVDTDGGWAAATASLPVGGATLVRPDGYVAWISPPVTDPASVLADTMHRILHPNPTTGGVAFERTADIS